MLQADLAAAFSPDPVQRNAAFSRLIETTDGPVAISRKATRRTGCSESFSEKNGTLVGFDILVDLANLHEHLKDDQIKSSALAWTNEEPDPKYGKKYLGVWK